MRKSSKGAQAVSPHPRGWGVEFGLPVPTGRTGPTGDKIGRAGNLQKGAPRASQNKTPHLSHQQQHQPQVDVTIGSSTVYAAEKITPLVV